MTVKKILPLLVLLFASLNKSYGQDTLRIAKKPKIILHSWYPEYKKISKFKIGESKLFFTILTGFEKTPYANKAHNYDIDIKVPGSNAQIKETIKRNQFIITVNPTNTKYIELEFWLDLKDLAILIQHNGKWKNIKDIYTVKENRILIDKVKIELVK